MSKKTFDVGIQVTTTVQFNVYAKNQEKANEKAEKLAENWTKMVKGLKKIDVCNIDTSDVTYVDERY